jgi:DnaA regulatory inactivator Hda
MTRANQLLLDLSYKPDYSSANFMKSPCNWEALEWIHRWPNWPMKMIAIYGEPSCGKTHLAHIWQEKSGASYLTMPEALISSPEEILKVNQAIILDDAELHTSTNAQSQKDQEEWMFHFYNLIKEEQKDLLICSRQAPNHWGVTLPDLRSRLSTILSVAVNPPDEGALHAVLLKLCAEKGMSLSSEVAEYILRRVERSFESIRNLVNILDHETLVLHRSLTLGLVRDVLSGLAPKHI